MTWAPPRLAAVAALTTGAAGTSYAERTMVRARRPHLPPRALSARPCPL